MRTDTDRPNWITFTGAWSENPKQIVDCAIVPAIDDPDTSLFDGKNTGLCVWSISEHYENRLRLEFRSPGDWLKGRMALWRAEYPIDPQLINPHYPCDTRIACSLAARAAQTADLELLAEAVNKVNGLQLEQGWPVLPSALHAVAYKYVGGLTGYAVYLFKEQADRDLFCTKPGAVAVEPYYIQ